MNCKLVLFVIDAINYCPIPHPKNFSEQKFYLSINCVMRRNRTNQLIIKFLHLRFILSCIYNKHVCNKRHQFQTVLTACDRARCGVYTFHHYCPSNQHYHRQVASGNTLDNAFQFLTSNHHELPNSFPNNGLQWSEMTDTN